tara:strand:+ start:5567 stop:6694 length:1128 start_codon:yes stop_codon:yes gene_type:complete
MINFLASKPENSKGRLFKEPENQPYRTVFQRDRDRIIHSTAFRKLKQKTQVFINSDSDYYRTRLTHTLEVSQISRTLSRTLSLNEDLSECIALAHDLGHPPFGHNGENILNFKMKDFDGFNHNEQTLRVINQLEKKYFDFDGLNLTWESLEGIVKHNGSFKNKVPNEINIYNKLHDLNLDKNPSLEGQIASISDDVAYNNHDIDDAIRANLIDIDQIHEIKYFSNIINKIDKKYINSDKKLLISEIIRSSINLMVEDIVNQTIKNINKFSINNIENIKNHNSFLVSMSNDMKKNCEEIKIFLYEKVYNNKNLQEKRKKCELIISCLFDYYLLNFSELPNDWKIKETSISKERIVCDYIAGMTDNYAYSQYKILYE